MGEELERNPFLGVELGHHLRKVCMAIASKGKGKRGGARVITYTVIIAPIYDKADRENITDAELLDILRRNGIE